MDDFFEVIADAFVEMAHRIVWASVATAWAGPEAACCTRTGSATTSSAPVGYDPAIIPPWSGGPTSDAFAVLRLTPWRLRVMPGTMMTAGQGDLLTWRAPTA